MGVYVAVASCRLGRLILKLVYLQTPPPPSDGHGLFSISPAHPRLTYLFGSVLLLSTNFFWFKDLNLSRGLYDGSRRTEDPLH